MSVHLLCTFEVAYVRDSPQGFRTKGTEHLMRIRSLPEDDQDADAIAMLEAVAKGLCVTEGRNGSMFAWGYVGNYCSWHSFSSSLTPFFLDCWNTGHLARSSHVVIFEQKQDQVYMRAIEVSLSPHATDCGPKPLTSDDLMIDVRELGMPIFKDFEGIPAIYRAPRLDSEPMIHHLNKKK